MSGSSKISLSNPTPYQLHSLVLDYLCHSCYTRTAAAFKKDDPSRQLDADGDEIIPASSAGGVGGPSENLDNLLKQVKLRQEIQTQILSGRVDDAIALLNRHFPTVLAEHVGATLVADSAPRPEISNLEYISSTSTEPAHLLLNLRILAFSEACRTIPLEYPPKPVSPDAMVTSPAFEEPEETPDYLEQQLALLTQAQKLYAFSKTLLDANDRATYLKELENVGGLLAYKVPEKSPMAKYMTMERREAVADQINRAILKRTGRPLVSALELITRYTSTLWQSAHQQGVKARPGASIVPPRSGKASPSLDADSEVVPTFDLQQFLDAKP